MKRCVRCNKEKEFVEFHKHSKRKDGCQTICKSCTKERNREYYLATPERNPQRQASRDRARQKAQEYVWNYLSTKTCIDCSESDPLVLELDHVRGQKLGDISDMAVKGYGIAMLQAELDKCDVRCANCHRRATAQRGNWRIVKFFSSRASMVNAAAC